MNKLITIILLTLLSGCILTKQERLNKRANRKLDNLTAKFPQLLDQDTLRDTVVVNIPEIRVDTVVEISKDVSGVDSIMLKFNDRLDSLTSIRLGDEIKYYITKRQVIEDTLTHYEDGVTVKVWQDGEVIRISVFKPENKVIKPVEIPYNKIVKAPPVPWYKQILRIIQRYGIVLIILGLILIGAIKMLNFLKNKFKINK